MKRKNFRVPRTTVKMKNDQFFAAVDRIIFRLQVVKGAREVLQKNRSLSPQANFGIRTEINTLVNVLAEDMGISRSYFMNKSREFLDSEELKEAIHQVVERITPGGTKLVKLYGEVDYKAVTSNKEVKNIFKGGYKK